MSAQTQQRWTQLVLLKTAYIATTLVFTLNACLAVGQATEDLRTFVNVADSTQGFSGLSQFPAINDRGSVAFVANRNVGGQGVFKWENGVITTIANSDNLSGFGDDVVINASGVVGYAANPTGGVNDRAIFTSNGSWTRLIADANQQGFVGRFLGAPSINASGMVAFFVFRKNFSQAILTGKGGALTTMADTANGTFSGFGNPAINRNGRVVFPGTLEDGSQGVFIATPVEGQTADNSVQPKPTTITAVTDPQNPLFTDPFATFGDPVINDRGIVADVGFPGSGNLEIFTGNGSGVVARTDPNSPFFIESEHPSLNNRGEVAFFARELGGGQGIFVERSGGASPVAVIEAGDTLFGSIVTGLDLGRFALNDRGQLAFHYDLEDGRSGVAILSPKEGSEQ